MAYIKNNWVDREGTTRYHETVDDDGALIFTPDYEKVTEIGTPVNADNMNHIEDGIEDHENRITVLENADGENFVKKSGDTMTGDLTFNKTSPHIILKDSNKDNTITPTSADDIYSKIQFRDKNDVWLGGVECKNRTNGSLELQLFANRTIGNTRKSASAYLSVDSTGKALFTFPRCTTKPTTTSTASDNSVAVVTQNYLNGQSWYRVWSDGFCEQGGVWNYTHNARYMSTTITLLKALKTVLYKGATSIDHPSISTVIANCDFSTTPNSEILTHVSLSAERLYTTTTSSTGKVYWEVKGFIN